MGWRVVSFLWPGSWHRSYCFLWVGLQTGGITQPNVPVSGTSGCYLWSGRVNFSLYRRPRDGTRKPFRVENVPCKALFKLACAPCYWDCCLCSLAWELLWATGLVKFPPFFKALVCLKRTHTACRQGDKSWSMWQLWCCGPFLQVVDMAAAPDFSYYSHLALCSQSGTCPWKENSTLHPVPFWEATNFSSFLPVFTLISLNKALLL